MWARQFNPIRMAAGDIPEFPAPADLVLVFGPTAGLRASRVMEGLAMALPQAACLACSTGSAVDGGALVDDGFSALALGFERTAIRIAIDHVADPAASHAAGEALARKLAADDLAGVFLLTDGLTVNGSALVSGLQAVLGSGPAISGGMAGDGARFAETLVAFDQDSAPGTVAAIGFYGEAIRFAHGCVGGWDAFGPHRRITASAGSVLHELDGRPALDLYESYLGDEAADLPASGLIYPLRIWDPAQPATAFVRTLLAIDRDAKALILAGDVPLGWHAQLMRGSVDRLIDGAAQAAIAASAGMAAQGLEPAACLFVSCVGRRLLLGQDTEDEIEQVHAALGGSLPMAGFYSYGEIAPQATCKTAGLHNQTVTLTLLAEAL